MAEQFDLFSQSEPEQDTTPEKTDSLGPRILYFDLETQKSAEEVGGWGNASKMGLAVGVVWDSHDENYHTYLEKDARALVEKLRTADLVVGFNVKGFDYTVLQPYANPLHVDLLEIPTFDMLEDIHRKLKHRLSLNNLAQVTLGAEKSADGLLSLQWYKEYLAGDHAKLDLIIDYCRQDVKITRELFLFGAEHGYVEYETKFKGTRTRLDVDWKIENLIAPSC